MSAPLIWILLPALFSVGLLLLVRWRRIVVLVGSGLGLIFAGLAWLLPLGKVLQLGLITIEILPSWSLFGRRFVLENSDRPFVGIVFMALVYWYLGTLSTKASPLLIPLGMGISAALTATICVQPIYYGAIVLLIATNLNVILFVTEGQEVHLGIKRYWVFQSIAMPFLLLAGWMISGTEANPEAIPSAALFYVLLLLGFNLLLSGFPFQSWLTATAEQINPYSFSFAFYLTSFSTFLFVITFIKQYPWLFTASYLLIFFGIQGSVLTLLGGIGAVYHRHLGRWLGYAFVKEIGVSFLIVGLGLSVPDPNAFLGVLFMQIFPRGVAMALLAFAGNLYREKSDSLQIKELTGLGRQFPVATLAFFVSILTLVGFPLTAAFPVHLLVWQGWFGQYPPIAVAAVFGSVGVLIGGLRMMAVLVRGTEDPNVDRLETRSQAVLLAISAILLLLVGVFPQWFLSFLYKMGLTFLQGG